MSGVDIGTLITAGASFIGAVIAALLGTLLGFQKFRKERSYDAQLEWHRELAVTVRLLRNRSRSIRDFKKRGNQRAASEVLPFLQEIGRLAFHFQELAEQAPMYAKKDTCVAISQIISDLNALAPQFDNPPDESSGESTEPHPWDVSMTGLDLVFDLLARDLREMLHLEPLETHQYLKKVEQTFRSD